MKAKLYAYLPILFLSWSTTMVQAQPGTLDPTFNGSGYSVNPVSDLDAAQKILVQDDQKVLLIGMSFNANYTARAYVLRYLPDGTPDTGFGINGVFSYQLDNEADIYSAVLTADGKILLAGATTDYQTYRLLLIQLNTDGTLDNSFGTAGVAVQRVSEVALNAEDIGYDVALDAEQNILVSGSSTDTNYVRRPIVVRFTPSGELDTTFGVDGVATIPVLEVGGNSFQGVAVQPDGKIVASGYFANTELWYVMLLVRFDTNGVLDPTFGDAGIVKFNYGNVDDEGEDLVLMPDGSILVCGVTVTQTYNYSALLAKFTPTGDLDSTFGTAGTVKEDLGMFDFASNVSLMSDGTIIMAGSSGVGPPNGFDMAVWKYVADGSRDITFGTDGVAQHQLDGYYAMINAMEVQADGKILIGGQARTFTNQNYFFVARLENDVVSAVVERSELTEATAFPKPSTAGTSVTVQFQGPIHHDARIDLYAADGRLSGTYAAKQLQRTAQGIIVPLAASLNTGIYRMTFQQTGTHFTSNLVITQ